MQYQQVVKNALVDRMMHLNDMRTTLTLTRLLSGLCATEALEGIRAITKKPP